MDFNFWTPFVLIMLLTALAVVSVTYAANILCCAILGAYATVLSIDYYLGSNLKFIIINTIRRAVVPNFNKATLSPPFQLKGKFFGYILCKSYFFLNVFKKLFHNVLQANFFFCWIGQSSLSAGFHLFS